MADQLVQYLNGVFAPYDGVKSVAELKNDLLADLEERLHDLQVQGKSEEEALIMTLNSIGDIEQTVQEMANLTRSLERKAKINLSAVDLSGDDFAGVSARDSKFEASMLRGANFAKTDLTGSTFRVSNLQEANLDGANLSDCVFNTSDLSGASLNKSILVRTTFNTSALDGTKFCEVNLVDVKVIKTDLRKTLFENCTFNGVDFSYCDLREMSFDGKTFIGVKFDKSSLEGASFKGATLKNVVFTVPFSLTNRSYRAMKTICFDGAIIDKITYAALKSLYVVDLSGVTII